MKDKDRKVVIDRHSTSKVPSICLDSTSERDDPHPSDKSRSTSVNHNGHHQNSGDVTAGSLKRLTKRTSRRESVFSHMQNVHVIPVQKMEPTYQLEPKCTFNACAVERIVKQVLKERLEHVRYDPAQCGRISQVISEDIKDRVKHLRYDRYKIVCYVTLGENKGQGLLTTSRCAWEPQNDTYASYTLTTKELFCTACVFGVYAE